MLEWYSWPANKPKTSNDSVGASGPVVFFTRDRILRVGGYWREGYFKGFGFNEDRFNEVLWWAYVNYPEDYFAGMENLIEQWKNKPTTTKTESSEEL